MASGRWPRSFRLDLPATARGWAPPTGRGARRPDQAASSAVRSHSGGDDDIFTIFPGGALSPPSILPALHPLAADLDLASRRAPNELEKGAVRKPGGRRSPVR